MRPIDKGTCPTDATGNQKSVTEYGQWRGDLIDRIGAYCVYCNMPLSHNLNVEHVIPKNPPIGVIAGNMLSWDNMLLACGPCNLTKTNAPINFNNYYFPDVNNTFLPFEILVHNTNAGAAIVSPRVLLNPAQNIKAVQTISLLGLNVIDKRDKIVDIRWKKRKEAIVAVDSIYLLYDQAKAHPNYNQNIAALAVATNAVSIGFFSIWFEKFQNEAEVIERLIDPAIIPGTAQNCFDVQNNYQLLPRNPANIIDPF